MSFYDFNVTTIDGKEFPLSSLKGKKVLVVNVASKCGLTPQYAKLQELYDKYKDENFVIIGFPCQQLYGTGTGKQWRDRSVLLLKVWRYFSDDGQDFRQGQKHGATLPMADGKETERQRRCAVQWNFQKFMIDENGNWVGFVAPKESPLSEKIVLG